MGRKQGWFTTVSRGGAMVQAYPTDWPRGPWRSRQEGLDALDRWMERRGIDESLMGTIEEAHNLRVVGPFRTREVARQADISDYYRYIEQGPA